MVPRKPLAPNNQRASLQKIFRKSGDFHLKYPKAIETPSIKTWPQRGRQNSEGFGGGYRVLRRGQ